MTLTKGDTVAARCTMVNHRDRITYIGTTNEDEMCNFYVMYWVHGKKPMEKNTCFSRGPPTWSWNGWFALGAGQGLEPLMEGPYPIVEHRSKSTLMVDLGKDASGNDRHKLYHW